MISGALYQRVTTCYVNLLWDDFCKKTGFVLPVPSFFLFSVSCTAAKPKFLRLGLELSFLNPSFTPLGGNKNEELSFFSSSSSAFCSSVLMLFYAASCLGVSSSFSVVALVLVVSPPKKFLTLLESPKSHIYTVQSSFIRILSGLMSL